MNYVNLAEIDALFEVLYVNLDKIDALFVINYVNHDEFYVNHGVQGVNLRKQGAIFAELYAANDNQDDD